jgi:type II secretory pathway pseudopilin PulG
MRIANKLTRLKQGGDTIIEVLIAMTIVSLILGGAYVTTNNSLLATRDAQEHDEALQLVQSQIEALKAIVATNATAVFGPSAPNPFCITNVTTVDSSSSANCTMDSAGIPVTTQPAYKVVITRTNSDFAVEATWPSVIGVYNDQIQINYRLYQ